MVKRAMAIAIAIVLSAMSVSAYAQQCLHGPNETPDQTARRREALAATRTINNIQFNQPGAAQRSFFRHAQLAESPTGKTMPTSSNELARRILLSPDSDILPGWKLTVDVSENGYWFMIKDTTDACGFAYISSHNGVIYTSEPIRLGDATVVRIRVASEADIPDMHRIRVSVRENRLLDPARVQPADYRPMLTGHGRGWVAELDHQVVGFAVANLSRANIWALFVDPDHEGRGVGRALHDTMLTWVFASGPERVSLTTDPGTRAERFYQAAGWRHVGMQHGESRYELLKQDWTRRNSPS